MLKLLNSNKPHFRLYLFLFVVLTTCSFGLVAETEVTVKPGQTLIKLMRSVYPDQRSRWPVLMREIVNLNPQAFENGDPRTLKQGSVIRLPEAGTQQQQAVVSVRAGVVKSLNGSVTVIDGNKKSRDVQLGAALYVGEQIITGENGSVELAMIDEATITLRCSSVLNIDEYKMRTTGSRSSVTLLNGSLATQSGRIGKRTDDQYDIVTPVATITTRQGEYGLRVRQSKGCQKQADVADDGLYLAVLNGDVEVANSAGKLRVASGESARVGQRTLAPEAYQAFAGMVFGEKFVEQVVKKPAKVVEIAPVGEAVAEVDNGVPVWWMIVGVLILGVML